MIKDPIHVVIVGAGIGGLCLAQGLKKQGVSVSVYERDEGPFVRDQGYRIHISPMGSKSLHDCLPETAYRMFLDTCGQFGQGFSILDEQLHELMSIGDPSESHVEGNRHRSVNRVVLRKILLCGLEQDVHFGKKFKRFDVLGAHVIVEFEDETTTKCDILVGADGVNSGVRKQFLPQAAPVNTGVVVVGGKVPLTPEVMAMVPKQLLNGPAVIMPSQPASLFMAIWKRDPHLDPLTSHSEADLMEQDYLLLGFGAKKDSYHLQGEPEGVGRETLMNSVQNLTREWHPDIKRLIKGIDVESVEIHRIRTSKKPEPWPTDRVTLIGDAIHSMTPYRGTGANVAMRDACVLSSKLALASSANMDPLACVHQYEHQMLDYAFAAVDKSHEMMQRAICEKSPMFAVVKLGMRFANAVPFVKKKIAAEAAEV